MCGGVKRAFVSLCINIVRIWLTSYFGRKIKILFLLLKMLSWEIFVNRRLQTVNDPKTPNLRGNPLYNILTKSRPKALKDDQKNLHFWKLLPLSRHLHGFVHSVRISKQNLSEILDHPLNPLVVLYEWAPIPSNQWFLVNQIENIVKATLYNLTINSTNKKL